MSQTLHVRCLVCGEVLAYRRDDTSTLLVHLRAKHPLLNLARLSWCCLQQDDCQTIFRAELHKSSSIPRSCKSYCKVFETGEKSYSYDRCGCGPCCKNKQSDPCGCVPVCESARKKQGGWRRSHSAGRLKERKKKEHNKMMYHTTVETWRPGKGKIVCPRCGFVGQPIVRRQRNKVYHSSLGALCMLGCWPICLLPFMLCGNQVVNLHCCQCNHYLGTYDRKKSVLIQQCPSASSSSTFQSRSAPTICSCKGAWQK